MTRERGNIDFNLLCKALDEISQEKLTDQVLFHVMGEPALYPNLVKAVNYAKGKGLKVHLTTNGSMMTKDIIDKLLSANIDQVLFSIQTPDKASFGIRRANIDFYEYKKHITLLIAQILRESKNTIATLSFLTTPFKWLILPSRQFRTIDDKKKLIDSIKSWTDDILTHLDANEAGEELKYGVKNLRGFVLRSNSLGWNRFKVSSKLFIEARPVGDWIHPALFSKEFHKAKIGCCEGLEKHFAILWNGDLIFCCVDFDGKTAFGNINKSTIKESFQGELVQNTIKNFKKLQVSHPYCQRCLGDVSLLSSLARGVGSLFYFKWYRKHWRDTVDTRESVVSHA